jgi:mannose-6-phosphate isomerase-like protein (cupin superfamily)
MKIRFDQIEAAVMPQFLGGEGALIAKIHKDEKNKILRGTLEPGSSIGLHCHKTSSETIFILSGKGSVLCDGVIEPLEAGDCHYCPQGHEHSLRCDSEEQLEFVAVVPEHN